MKFLYRPALRVPWAWLGADVASPPSDPVSIPAFDEDAATMAVEAAQRVLAFAGLPAERLEAVELRTSVPHGIAPTVAAALGIDSARVVEASSGAPPIPPKGERLVVEYECPRPGGRPPFSPTGAFARAALAPAWESTASEIGPPPVAIEKDLFDRMARWEREAPRRVPMGAYVPAGTWDRSVPARYRLLTSRCSNGHAEFPPRVRCGVCSKPAHTEPLPRQGLLETYTVIGKGAAPSEYEPLQDVHGEYAVGVVEFGGVRVPGLFTETPLDALRVGLPVEPVFRRLFALDGGWRYGTKFRGAELGPQASRIP